MDTGERLELEIQGTIEADIRKWREAKQQANPHGYITVAREFEMRRCITELERAKRGLPLEAEKHLQGGVAWEARTFLDAQQSKIAEPPWKVKGLVVEGGATQVSAHPHGMKSLSWLNAALEAVAFHTVWGYFDASNVQRALYIESEDPPWLVEARIKELAKGLGLEPDKEVPGFGYFCPGPFDLVQEEDSLREFLAKHQPDFAVLSTLQSMLAGRDWASQKEMQDVNAVVVRLSRVCPLVVLTHSPWDYEQRRAAGTITQFANFAVTMHYQRVKPRRESKAEGGEKRPRKSKGGEADATRFPIVIDPNDPALTSEPIDVNLEADAYAVGPSRSGSTIHVVVDSKMGSYIDDFHLKLLTEGDEVRRLVFGGEGRPRGVGKDAVIKAIAADPEASAEEIAERAGVSDRYVRVIKVQAPKKRRRKAKASADTE